MSKLKSVTGTFAANGNSSECNIKSGAIVHVGGSGGTDFGGGTVTIQFQGSDGAWYNSQETMTAANVLRIETPVPCNIRLNLASSTSPDLDYVIQSDVVDLVE